MTQPTIALTRKHLFAILEASVMQEDALSNRAWRLDRKHGAAYIENRSLASRMLGLETERARIDHLVMATYLSPAGKAYAWQVTFDMREWDRVSQALGVQTCEQIPTILSSSPEPAGKGEKVRTVTPAKGKARSKASAQRNGGVKPKASAEEKGKGKFQTPAPKKEKAKSAATRAGSTRARRKCK